MARRFGRAAKLRDAHSLEVKGATEVKSEAQMNQSEFDWDRLERLDARVDIWHVVVLAALIMTSATAVALLWTVDVFSIGFIFICCSTLFGYSVRISKGSFAKDHMKVWLWVILIWVVIAYLGHVFGHEALRKIVGIWSVLVAIVLGFVLTTVVDYFVYFGVAVPPDYHIERRWARPSGKLHKSLTKGLADTDILDGD